MSAMPAASPALRSARGAWSAWPRCRPCGRRSAAGRAPGRARRSPAGHPAAKSRDQGARCRAASGLGRSGGCSQPGVNTLGRQLARPEARRAARQASWHLRFSPGDAHRACRGPGFINAVTWPLAGLPLAVLAVAASGWQLLILAAAATGAAFLAAIAGSRFRHSPRTRHGKTIADVAGDQPGGD